MACTDVRFHATAIYSFLLFDGCMCNLMASFLKMNGNKNALILEGLGMYWQSKNTQKKRDPGHINTINRRTNRTIKLLFVVVVEIHTFEAVIQRTWLYICRTHVCTYKTALELAVEASDSSWAIDMDNIREALYTNITRASTKTTQHIYASTDPIPETDIRVDVWLSSTLIEFGHFE